MKYRSLLLYSAAIPIMVPAAAFAQAQQPQQIVVRASVLEQSTDETATPVITLSGEELTHRRQATLGDTLGGLPGINVDNFGGGASRPVIRGQTAPRVEILSDSSSVQDASEISPDHAVVTEPLLLRGIEVLRGPSALLYGGSAIGGAVNLLDDKIPTAIPERGVSGALEGRLGTGDDERAMVGAVTVGIGQFALHGEAVGRTSDDYNVPSAFGEDHVHGSYNDTWTYSVGGSWVGANGYLGVAYTNQSSDYGLPGHSHEYEDCHPHGSSIHCGGHSHDDGDHDHDHDHDHEEPFVKLRSERFDIRGEYRDLLSIFERARLRVSFTDYEHSELEGEEIATTFTNKAHDIRVELTHMPLGPLRGVFGVQHSNSEFAAVGEEQFLPPSETRNTAVFLMETLQAGPVRLELAGRHEWQTIETADGRRAEHNPFSVSGAAVLDFAKDFSVALSVARSQRAPNVQELYSNTLSPYRGVHLATNTWEIGTPTLGKETGRSVDLTLRKTAGATTFTLGAYHQDFDNYIFADTLDQFEDFRLIRYTAGDATFSGFDGEIRHAFSDNFAASVFGDYVRAKLKDDQGNLPRIPAGRLGARVDAKLAGFKVDAEYYHVFEQDQIASFETATPGYDMVNATVAYRFDLGTGSGVELFARGTNLTNELAYNHSSFIKNAAPLRGRNIAFGARAFF